MIADKLNQLERSIAAAESQISAAKGTVTEAEAQIEQRRSEIDDARWAQAEEICRLLDAKLATQQEIASGWFKPDGGTYTQVHVTYCKKVWEAFITGGYKQRSSFATAYAKAKSTPSARTTKSGKPRKPRTAKPKGNTRPRQPTALTKEEEERVIDLAFNQNMPREDVNKALGRKPSQAHPVQLAIEREWGRREERQKQADAAAAQKPPGKSWNGTTPSGRQKQLRAEMKQTHERDPLDLMELQLDVNRCAADIRVVDVDDFDYAQFMVLKCANSLYDDLISLSEWIDRTQRKLNRHLTTIQLREKIKKLRDVRGRGPEEAESYLKLADELERRLTIVHFKDPKARAGAGPR